MQVLQCSPETTCFYRTAMQDESLVVCYGSLQVCLSQNFMESNQTIVLCTHLLKIQDTPLTEQFARTEIERRWLSGRIYGAGNVLLWQTYGQDKGGTSFLEGTSMTGNKHYSSFSEYSPSKLHLTEEKGSLVWKVYSKSIFTVRSAYKDLTGTNIKEIGWPWRLIWKTKKPYKNTKERVNHLFLHCKWTDQLWQMFIDKRKIRWVKLGRIKKVLRSWNRDGNAVRKEKRWKMDPACKWWTIWKERNHRCFEGKKSNIHKIRSDCLGACIIFGVNKGRGKVPVYLSTKAICYSTLPVMSDFSLKVRCPESQFFSL
ncbi:hypothetical protein H5410_016736 [Solanum commersonii]|uniref:Uncharacterized protein n=1 Tax=Solanum commersonii TaxID=4109 RepID=A0A9J5ZXD9_SOLCO|nr:hypothetical protein H5410_016736 [Solanum commersonii]